MEPKKAKVNDQILNVVEQFITYFEEVDKKNRAKEQEKKDDYSR